jgi:hypothetical protein
MSSEAPATPPTSSPYVYKMLQIPPSIVVDAGVPIGRQAASYLEGVVSEQAKLGWDFYRVDTIGVRVPPGCLGAFLGEQTSSFQYYVVTFRRRRDSNYERDVAAAAQLEAQRTAEAKAQRERRAQAEAAAQREYEAALAARRASRDAAYRAKGIEPGPLAWFKALPDTMQAIFLGLAFAIPMAGFLIFLFFLISKAQR